MDVSLRHFLVNFKISNHSLPIKEGRFNKIARADRKYLVCDSIDIGDTTISVFAQNLMKFVKTHWKKILIRNPSVEKCCDLLREIKQN